ncbi:MAG: protein kinase, partial [Planctomycetales bacterium]|nr:protein kinase [Planctomycetales bacterium]
KGGRVKILDFGLARATDDRQNLTQSGAIVGTPSYLSPEQATGQGVDERTDLFSLGVVFYQMLTGKKPFERESTFATLRAIDSETPVEPSVIRSDVPVAVSDLVMRLLKKAPDERFQSAAELIAAVEDSELNPEPTSLATGDNHGGFGTTPSEATGYGLRNEASTVPHPRSRAKGKEAASRRTLWIAATALGLIGLIGAAVIVVNVKTDRGTIVIKADGFEVTTENELVTIREKESGVPYTVRIGEVKSLPLGDYELVVENGNGLTFKAKKFTVQRGNRSLEVALEALPTGENRDDKMPVVPQVAKLSQPLSPLALTATPTKIEGVKSWSLESRLHRSGVYVLKASQDGKLVASAGDDGTLRIWRTEDFEPVQVIYLDPAASIQSPSYSFYDGAFKRQPLVWSHDGKYLAYATPQRVCVLDTDTWEEAYSHRPSVSASMWHLDWSVSGLLLINGSNGSPTVHTVHIVDIGSGRALHRRTLRTEPFFCCWEEAADRVLMTSDDAKQIVAWDVRRDRDEELGPFQPGRMYSPNFTRYVVIDAENKHWLVKSCADDAHLCSVPLPIDSLPNT